MHVLRGVEIYRDKPIFYGLGEFFCEMQWAPVEANTYVNRNVDALTTEVTDAELADNRTPTPDGTRADYESVLALTRYDGGRLVEILLYPIELRYDGPLSQWGIPLSRAARDRPQDSSADPDTVTAVRDDARHPRECGDYQTVGTSGVSLPFRRHPTVGGESESHGQRASHHSALFENHCAFESFPADRTNVVLAREP